MTADTLVPPRTPQGKASIRKKGPNLEKWGWVFMRVSGVLLIVLIFGHLFSNLMVGDGISGLDFAFVAGKLANPLWQWWDVAMLWLAFIHGTNGMRTIVNDYVSNAKVRRILVVALWAVAAFMILLGTLVVFTFDPCIPNLSDASILSEACKAQG
ncbi:succinate dehydrogenase / fumarate reductase membrane anchor subunit [Microbacterium marinum]|uniref:Succinate dehydrogenase / fumarate reductase membrane anchor subunit n=1 Tax=Microbacterium marinum TaxID=421115 RepID=A0A7W7BP71_9MICO|nr:succinate dehydrogenase hydrophobic membrane anchor subunit [Microbacterium marinum]MBB4666299.1 succinate dehydrogenase / fumarate reductase membrane anchor subunit [Microbacterium marinum]